MEVAFSEEKIQKRIRQMAGEISRDYGAALINREDKRHVPFRVDYSGFPWDGSHWVGYSLEKDGMYRNLPYMALVPPTGDATKKDPERAKREAREKQ